jgi:geranylgeranylglycerol-phosphate geranylgeranyltransferase
MGSLGVFIGIIIGTGLNIIPYLEKVILAVFIVLIFMAGANALNDYYDRNTDKINHPERPIPSRKIRPITALNFGTSVLFISIILAVFINLTSFLIVLAAALLIILYEIHYKNRGLIGNLMISLLVALVFIFGGAVVTSFELNIILAGMAFFATLGREIVKDIEDIKGDQDRYTLPKRIGIKPAGYTASIMVIIAIAISPLPYLHQFLPFLEIGQSVNLQYLIIVFIADIVFILSLLEIKSNPKKASLFLKIGMLFALLAFLSAAIFPI